MEQEIAVKMIKLYSRSFYDFQKVKNEFAGRMRASEDVEHMPEERSQELDDYKKSLEIAEKKLIKIIEPYLKEIPVYNEFLIKIKGCAVRMSACVVASVQDIKRFQTVSKLWAYAGMHVINGKAARRKKGEKANWNSFLKTKLHVLADCLIKLNFDDEKKPLRYRKFYDDYKNRMENRVSCHLTKEEHSKVPVVEKDPNADKPTVTWLKNGCTKGHTHNMAMRYVQKMFLQDLFMEWYRVEGLEPPTRPYAEAILGRIHGKYPKPEMVNS